MIRVIVEIDESRQHVEIKSEPGEGATSTEAYLGERLQEVIRRLVAQIIETAPARAEGEGNGRG